MTMHLLGPAYTTTNHSKRKSKMSTSKYTKIGLAWLEDCKFCKRIGVNCWYSNHHHSEAVAFGLVDKPIKQLAMAAKWHPRAVTKTAPETVKNNLRRGLEQYAEGLAGDGLEKATVLEAESLVAGEAPTEAKVQKANAWWGRNARFLEAEPNTPADVAANLWGGAAGRDWFQALYAQLEREENEENESPDDKISADGNQAVRSQSVGHCPNV